MAGTATTFSLTTPLLSDALAHVFGIENSKFLAIFILALIGITFMIAVLKGMKAISYLANFCVIVFVTLLGIFLLFGPKVYIIETGITAIGNMVNNFFSMATWMDPLRLSGGFPQLLGIFLLFGPKVYIIETGITAIGNMVNNFFSMATWMDPLRLSGGFPQSWTIFYWAYWIAWFVATPFFIAKISEGRTIKNTILGGLCCGLAGTFTSFIIFGGYGLHLQTSGVLDIAGMIANGVAPSAVILEIFSPLPMSKIALVVLIIAMIAFYASTFDAITMVVASYSEKSIQHQEEPRKQLRAFWSIVFLLLPVALLFNESTLEMLKTISVIAAFPLGCIMLLVVISFFKELKGEKK